jgi:hypothetical protein
MNQLYETQREHLLNLKKGIAFQKAFMASVERLKDEEIAKRTRLSLGSYSTNIKDWRNANEKQNQAGNRGLGE